MRHPFATVLTSLLLTLAVGTLCLGEQPKKVLLLGASRDHPPGTHEYMAGLRVLAKRLERAPGLEVSVIPADDPWTNGPDLLKQADGVMIFLGQGARWLHAHPERLKALTQLAARGGGLVGLHWGIGAKDAKYIARYLDLVGGCHGGPDRKYKILEGEVQVVDQRHPITFGVRNFQLHDEFYYRLKLAKKGSIRPILQVSIDGKSETVAWAFERPDGGRSFGFSGMHFHRNWRVEACRRLIVQGLLWTLKLPIPKEGLAVDVTEGDPKLK